MSIPPLAAELNATLEKEAPSVLAMLSDVGKRFFFPKGIISQSTEAKEKAHKHNATIGIATENGVPMHLACVRESFRLEPKELFPYAPTGGKPELRVAWRAKQAEQNPSLGRKKLGSPIVTAALTHGLGVVSELFVNPGDKIILPDKIWGNYRLTFVVRQGGSIETFPFFDGQSFNRSGFRAKMESLAGSADKAVIILNFPNNPTGFTPSKEDAEAITSAVLAAAEKGLRQVIVCDDAYFGLFYDETCLKESIFASLANIHPNVLAIKLDGATKEQFAWGFRVGFLTYAAGGPGDLDAVHSALEKKTIGLIRAVISNCPHPSQSAILKALGSPDFEKQRGEKREILRARVARLKDVLRKAEYAEAWTPYPFNSGYFMCVRMNDVDAETFRCHLLEKYGVGVIATDATDIRVAFSCVEVDQIEDVFDTMYRAWKDVRASSPSL